MLRLTLSWRRSLPYRNQSIDLLRKSMDLFPYDNGLRHEKVNSAALGSFTKHWKSIASEVKLSEHVTGIKWGENKIFSVFNCFDLSMWLDFFIRYQCNNSQKRKNNFLPIMLYSQKSQAAFLNFDYVYFQSGRVIKETWNRGVSALVYFYDHQMSTANRLHADSIKSKFGNKRKGWILNH